MKLVRPSYNVKHMVVQIIFLMFFESWNRNLNCQDISLSSEWIWAAGLLQSIFILHTANQPSSWQQNTPIQQIHQYK